MKCKKYRLYRNKLLSENIVYLRLKIKKKMYLEVPKNLKMFQ